jgi:hypothetical protein
MLQIDHSSCDDAISMKNLLSVEWYERMVTFSEIERIKEKAVVAWFKDLSRNTLGDTEENYEKLQ